MARRPHIPEERASHAPLPELIASRATGQKVLLVFPVIVIFCSIVAAIWL